MPGFIYFLRTDKRLAVEADLITAGLGYAITPGGVSSLRTERGPDGGPGLLVTFNADKLEPGYSPERQVWRRGPGQKPGGGSQEPEARSPKAAGDSLPTANCLPPTAYWIGVDKEIKPGPAELARPRLYEGTRVTLLDDNEWIVPRCVGVLPETCGRPATLPRIMDLAEDGETILSKPHPRYADLVERAFGWWKQWSRLASEGEAVLTAAQQVQLAVDALAVNYRIAKLEAIGLLSLWSSDEFGLVLRALIDADEVEAYYVAMAGSSEGQKKST